MREIRVTGKGSAVGCTASGSVLSGINWTVLARRLGVSLKQGQIIQLIVLEDLTVDALAIRLGITTGAVRTQISRIRATLGVRTRAAIVTRAWEAWVGMQGQ